MTKAVAKLYRKAQSKNKEILNKCKSFSVSTNWIKFEQYPHRVIPTKRKVLTLIIVTKKVRNYSFRKV